MRKYSEKEKEALRQTILEASRTLLSTKGWAGVTVREIAGALGTSRGPVQDNFTQSELAARLVELTYDVLFDVTAQVPGPYRVDDIVRTVVATLRTRRQAAAFTVHVIATLALSDEGSLPGLPQRIREERTTAIAIIELHLSKGLDREREWPVEDVAPALLRWFELACSSMVTNPQAEDADLLLLRRAFPSLT